MTHLAQSLSPLNSTLVRFSAYAATRAYFRLASRFGPGLARRHAERLFTTPPRPIRAVPVPAAAKRLSVLTPAGHVTVWQAGPDSAPAVLLVHGWGGVGAQLGTLVEPLLAQGRRVVWYDHPGHGESEGQRTALPDLVRALKAVADACGPFESAIGHSLGGVTIALALRDGLRLQRAVLIGTPASLGEHMRSFARQLGISAPVRDRLQAGLEARHGQTIEEIDRIADLARVGVPTLLVHDSDDRQVPFENAERIASHLPAARLLRTYGLGHHRLLRAAPLLHHIVGYAVGSGATIPCEWPALPDPAPIY